MVERLTDLVGQRVTVTNPIHTESRWTGQAIAYSDGPAFLIETEDGHRLMLPATWAAKAESHAAPKRIQMSRKRSWRAENPDAVIVARPSRWGNPFPVDRWGLDLSLALFSNTARAIWNPSTLGQDRSDDDFSEAYAANTTWLRRMGSHPIEIARLELAGKDLACWCPLDQPCHADVLLKLANGPSV